MSRRSRKRCDWEDDGRTIADMSGVERPSLFGHIPGIDDDRRPAPRRPSDVQEDLTPEERKWAVLGALKAALSIGMVYLVGFLLLVGVLLLVWHPWTA